MWLSVNLIPFIWSPLLFWIVLGLVVLVYNVQITEDNSYKSSNEIITYRFMIHRTALAFTTLHCILLLITTASNKVLKSLLLCGNTGSLQWLTRVGSVALILITVLMGTPDWFIDVYAYIIAPILGIIWLVYQGYIILYLALQLHVLVSYKVRDALKSKDESVGFTVCGLNYQINPVHLSRGATAIYIILFIIIVVLLGNIATSDIFPSSLSSTIIGGSIVLGMLSIAISTNKNTNRGILIPTLFMVYMISVVLSILFLDPANPHNISIEQSSIPSGNSSSNGGHHNSLFIRYSALLQGYANYNDVMNGVIYIVCAYFCLIHYHHSSLGEARTALKRSYDGLVHMTQAACIGRYWRSDVGSGKRASEEESWREPSVPGLLSEAPPLSLFRSSSTGSSAADSGTSSSSFSNINNSAVSSVQTHTLEELNRNEEEKALEEGYCREGKQEWTQDGDAASHQTTGTTSGTTVLRPSQELQVNSSFADKTLTSATAVTGMDILDPLTYLPIHYIRMILLLAYTALLLTNWSPLTGTSSRVSIDDLHIVDPSTHKTLEYTLIQQYFILVLYIIAWISLWIMYLTSLYSTYYMKCQYIKIRNNIYCKLYSEYSDAEIAYEEFVDADINKPFPRVYID